ncbi:MAG: DUF1385 domain-containing protein [Ruminococcaceae bacterium]|nr:DUF1385 domain-containing protein [Oscillospiraceae bacterium]
MSCNKDNIKAKKITSIGGSALIEGVMMRGPKKVNVSVRTGKDKIESEELEFKSLSQKGKFFRLPMIRGIVGMIDSFRLSYKALMMSADKAINAIETDEEEMSKFEKWLNDKLGEKFMGIIMTLASVLGIALAFVLFFWLPTFLYNLIISINFPDNVSDVVNARLTQSIFEGVVKIILFVCYILLVSRMEDMKRVFMYHGAEHKTIFCYEADEELTVENVRKHKRFHPRCGTSFIIIMLILGIIIGLFVPQFTVLGVWGTVLRSAIKILLLPITIGVGYELIKICGKHDNKFTRIIAAPGLWAQRITTREPSDDIIEVAIAAITPVIPDDGSDIISCK